MIRCWLRRLFSRKSPPSAHPESESCQALERAIEAREEVDANWSRVGEVTSSLSKLRRNNHFIEGFRRTL